MRIQGLVHFSQRCESVALGVSIGEVASAHGGDRDDGCADGDNLSVVLFEDDVSGSRMEWVIDADRLALGAIADAGLVALPHVEGLWSLGGSPVVGVWEKLPDRLGLQSVAASDDTPDRRIDVEKHLTALAARGYDLLGRAVDGDDSGDRILRAFGGMIGQSRDLTAGPAEEVVGVEPEHRPPGGGQESSRNRVVGVVGVLLGMRRGCSHQIAKLPVEHAFDASNQRQALPIRPFVGVVVTAALWFPASLGGVHAGEEVGQVPLVGAGFGLRGVHDRDQRHLQMCDVLERAVRL